MKSKVTGNNCCKEKPFPKLMCSSQSDVVVLMTKPGHGTILSGTNILGNTVGEFVDSWRMKWFSDFEGTITLEN